MSRIDTIPIDAGVNDGNADSEHQQKAGHDGDNDIQLLLQHLRQARSSICLQAL